jgi:hypothetical protein
MNKSILVIVIISLFFTVTNFIPVSALASGVSFLILPFLLFNKSKYPRYLSFLILFFFFTVISVLTYSPSSFAEYKFYRYDGNFFVSYAPVFLIPIVVVNVDMEKLIRRFLDFVTAVNGIAFMATIAINKFHLSSTESFGGLFIARNAAGGFLSFVITLSFVQWLREKTTKNLALILLNTFFLVATFSRGSLVGIAFAILCYYLLNAKNRGAISFSIMLAVLLAEAYFAYQNFPTYRKINYENRGGAYVLANSDMDTKSANIALRLYKDWPSGIDLFLHSPIVGGGFGAVNDRPYRFKDKVDLINYNQQRQKTYNDAHAHNSYFNLAGEEGLIGLTLFLLFACSLYIFLNKLPDEKYFIPKYGLLLYLLNIASMSLTEHRFTSPSNALPLVLLLVVFMAKINYDNYKYITN